jgi:hypothetical protein
MKLRSGKNLLKIEPKLISEETKIDKNKTKPNPNHNLKVINIVNNDYFYRYLMKMGGNGLRIETKEKININNIIPCTHYDNIITIDELYNYDLRPFESIKIITNIKEFSKTCFYISDIVDELNKVSNQNDIQKHMNFIRKVTWINVLYNYFIDNYCYFRQIINDQQHEKVFTSFTQNSKRLSKELITRKLEIEKIFHFSDDINNALFKLASNLQHSDILIEQKLQRMEKYSN